MKHFQSIGLMLLLLSACTPQPTPTLAPTFTPSPTPQVLTSTPEPSATATPAAQATSATETPEPPCKDAATIVTWLRDDSAYDFIDANKNKPIPPNGHFTMTWTFQNTGHCIWDSSYQLAFKSGYFFTQAQSYPIVLAGQTVAPGQSTIVNVSMVAPNKTGGYQAVWQLQDTKGKAFLNLNVIIKIDRGSSNPPAHPANLTYTYSCAAGIGRIRLAWTDTANNEDGYHIYRGGLPLVDLPANASSYADVVPGIGTYAYAVVAFNAAGEAPANISAEVAICK